MYSKRIIFSFDTILTYLPSLRKVKGEIARVPLIFAYYLVIECAEKSGAQVIRDFFRSLNRHKLLTERETRCSSIAKQYKVPYQCS